MSVPTVWSAHAAPIGQRACGGTNETKVERERNKKPIDVEVDRQASSDAPMEQSAPVQEFGHEHTPWERHIPLVEQKLGHV